MSRGFDGARMTGVAIVLANVILMANSVVAQQVLRASSTAGPRSTGGASVTILHAFKPIVRMIPYWGFLLLFVLLVPWMGRVGFDRTADRLTRERTFRDRSMRRSARTTGIIVAAILGLGVMAGFVQSPRLGLMLIGAGLAFGGGLLIPFGIFNRRGVRLVCARCDYTMSTWLGSPGVCPECGAAWKEPWRARLGVRRRRSGLVALGVAMLALSVAVAAVGAWMM